MSWSIRVMSLLWLIPRSHPDIWKPLVGIPRRVVWVLLKCSLLCYLYISLPDVSFFLTTTVAAAMTTIIHVHIPFIITFSYHFHILWIRDRTTFISFCLNRDSTKLFHLFWPYSGINFYTFFFLPSLIDFLGSIMIYHSLHMSKPL
jgi:hypothetical protein